MLGVQVTVAVGETVMVEEAISEGLGARGVFVLVVVGGWPEGVAVTFPSRARLICSTTNPRQ